MKLLERYATACGLSASDIGSQHLIEQFYPLPFSDYITLHAASGMQGKNYPFYQVVIELIKPYLAQKGIEIVQLGVKEDPAIPGCHHTMGKTSLYQANYLVARSRLHLANDSVWCHRAGHLGIPLVELFATTSEANHAPYQFNADKSRFISSHRWGRNPTFAAQESQSTATLICPFSVARAVLDLLQISHAITQKTVFMGHASQANVLDYIPNMPLNPAFNPDVPCAVRMDLDYNEQNLVQVLQSGRKINIVTKQPINPNILAHFKGQILSYNHELDENCPLDYLRIVNKMPFARVFFSRSRHEDTLAALRFRYFDVVPVQQIIDKTKEDFEKAAREYLNDPSFSIDSALNSGKLLFKTNKFVLSKGKIYLSLAHEKADIPIQDNLVVGKLIDEDYFWHDQIHMMVFTQ